MKEKSASIKISIKEGEFEINGSELFVTQQIENFRELIIDSLKNETFNEPKEDSSSILIPEISIPTNSVINENFTKEKDTNEYPNVLHIEDGQVTIIKNFPNKSFQSGAVMVSIVLTYANYLSGKEETTYKEVAEECKRQACYDGKNFSSHLKKTKPFLIIKGSTRTDKILKLTMPGIEKAKEILEQLNAN
jgi:hypothetical protein